MTKHHSVTASVVFNFFVVVWPFVSIVLAPYVGYVNLFWPFVWCLSWIEFAWGPRRVHTGAYVLSLVFYDIATHSVWGLSTLLWLAYVVAIQLLKDRWVVMPFWLAWLINAATYFILMLLNLWILGIDGALTWHLIVQNTLFFTFLFPWGLVLIRRVQKI